MARQTQSQKTNNWFVCQVEGPDPDSSSDDDGINDPLTLTTNMPSEGGREAGEGCQMAGRSIHLASIGLKSIGLRVDAAAVRRVLCSALLCSGLQSSRVEAFKCAVQVLNKTPKMQREECR